MRSICTINPRYQETDKMGIIHHSVYPVWYELGRVKFCDDIGFPFHKIEERNMYQALIELKVKYMRPTVFGKTYKLHTFIKAMTKVKLIFGYELYNDQDELVNQGETLLAWLDKDLKPLNIARYQPDIYQLLLENFKQN
ncbi:MAG: acyl-CoA thioesterase [Candidatus Izemoplasmataceae bacterium]|jgi:acyl-CoA thioester hydrolase